MPRHTSKRPSLQDAHKYQKDGSWSFGGDYLSREERISLARAAAKEIEQKCKTALPRTRSLELLILKCHIIIEFALESYIHTVSTPTLTDRELAMSFAEKLNVAYILGLGSGDATLLPSIELLNQIRNKMAHKLIVDEVKLDELIRINSEEYHKRRVFSKVERLQGLKWVTYYVCGMISGGISVLAMVEPGFGEKGA
jgi:hypothetical protein